MYTKRPSVLLTLLCWLLISLPLNSWGHQISTRHQYWWLKGPDLKSWRQDLSGEWNLSSSNTLMLSTSHFERFRNEEQLVQLGWRKKTARGYWELTHADGGDNKILARRDTQITYGQALLTGLSGWVTLKAQEFAHNDLHSLTVGLEKEWSTGYFFVPFLTTGKTTFDQPANTNDIWAVQAKVGYYRERLWKIAFFSAMGEEYQAQVSLGQTSPLRVTSYGILADYWLGHQTKLDFVAERNFYPSINTRFEAFQLALTYLWGKQ